MAEGLDGKVAVVTGASTGIGRAVAQELVGRGAAVVIAARSRERVDEAAAALGGRTGVVADVTRAEDVARLIDGTIETHGRIDILVANAGVYVGGDLWESDPEALDRLLTTNVNGVVRTVRAVLPHLLERGEGDILVTSSVVGPSGDPLGARLLGLQARAPGVRPRRAPAADRHRHPHRRDRPGHRAQRPVGRLRSRRDRGQDRARRGDPVRGRG